MTLINGQVCSSISINDRGLAYGDGLFETLAVINGKIHNWDLHFQRLVSSADRLKFPEIVEAELLSDIVHFVQSNEFKGKDRFIIKLIITRGESERGYTIPVDGKINRICLASQWPSFPQAYYQQGINLNQINLKLGKQTALAGIKHLNRLEQVLAQSELDDEFQEGFICNGDNQLVSAVSANIYYVYNDVLHILNQASCGVAGTIRAQIIKICQQKDIAISDELRHYSILKDASEVFLSNSIRGLWPVKKIHFFSGEKLNYKTGEFYTFLASIINQELGYKLKQSD